MGSDQHTNNKQSVNESKLKRNLSLSLLIFYGVGTILGLGIYVLTGKIAGEAGMLAPFSFLVAAILAGFTGVSYGELSARIPKSAGEVNYVSEAFHLPWLSKLIGWLIVLSAIVSTSTVVNGYVGYFQVFLNWPSWVIIVAIVCLLGGVAIAGIKESALLITLITIIELSGILFVIVVGFDNMQQVGTRWEELVPQFQWSDWEKVTLGAFLAFFAFIGFEDMVNVSEEARNPKKNMPVAILVSIVILTVLYVLVSLIASFALTPEELNQSTAPLADILASKNENYPKLISMISLVAIINGVLVQIIMCARVLYGMAEKKMAHPVFYRVNSFTRTPVWGTLFTVVAVLILALSFELEGLAKATSYILLSVFAIVNLSLIRIKKKTPKPAGVRIFPIWVPYFGFVFSLAVIIIQLVSLIY